MAFAKDFNRPQTNNSGLGTDTTGAATIPTPITDVAINKEQAKHKTTKILETVSILDYTPDWDEVSKSLRGE